MASRQATVTSAIGVLAAYAVLWLAFDRLAYSYSWHATPWYLGTALSFYLVYAFGVRYSPAIVAIEVARGLISSRHHLTWDWLFALGMVNWAIITPTAYAARRFGIRALQTFNDTVSYLALACIAMPALRAVAGVLILCLSGDTPWSRYWSTSFSFAIGDMSGMLTLVPFLLVFVSPRIAPHTAVSDERGTRVMKGPEIATVVALMCGGILGAYYVIATKNNAQAFYFVFIPLTWMALRGGLRWAIGGSLLSGCGVVALHYVFRTAPPATAAYQSYLVGSAITTLMLGVIVNQRKREEREAIERARRDPLSGLPNRQGFETWLASHGPSSLGMALFHVEFAAIRLADEWLEPENVSALIAGIAERLTETVVDALTVAHLAPDRFAVAVLGDDRQHAAYVADRIVRAFEQPVNVGETELFATPRIGIALGAAEASPSAIQHHAARAAADARSHSSEVAFYDARRASESAFSLSAQLHRALERDEFLLYYQPIWSCDGMVAPAYDRLIGAEALLRWKHPERGILSPDAFIELLESIPLSERVGAWVVEEACRQLSIFQEVLPACSMWINLFARQAVARTLAFSLEELGNRYDFPEGSLVVELNEKMTGDEDVDMSALVQRLHFAGVRVAVDDFGHGYSSYARVREIPFDILKIDRSFVSGHQLEGKISDVLAGLVRFANDIGVEALAEGVERVEQLDLLGRSGCRLAQGHLLGPPLPPEAFLDLVRQRSLSGN